MYHIERAFKINLLQASNIIVIYTGRLVASQEQELEATN